MTTIVVEPSEAWPVVAAGLGSAVIVGWITSRVAKKQRKADSERFDKQLVHDRDMRAEDLKAASTRLDRQLAHDRAMQEQQKAADSLRLQWQLGEDRQLRQQQFAHDREMRDLQHLRETLTPIVARALDWGSFISLHKALSTAEGVTEQTQQVISDLANRVGDESEQLRHGSRTLIILAGPKAEVAHRLREIANDGDALVRLARTLVEVGWLHPEFENQLQALFAKYGEDHKRFIEAANEAVRWGEAESSSN